MNLTSTSNCSHYEQLLKKIKALLVLAVFTVSSFNVSAQSTSLISACGDFVSGPSAWPYVLVATTVADGAVSQGSQTYTMNVTTLPASGANFRVYKTTANGSAFFGMQHINSWFKYYYSSRFHLIEQLNSNFQVEMWNLMI